MVAFGGGIFLFDPLRLAVFESLLPNGSSQLGPPLCFKESNKFHDLMFLMYKNVNNMFFLLLVCTMNSELSQYSLTRTVEPLAARARMSAQDTV